MFRNVWDPAALPGSTEATASFPRTVGSSGSLITINLQIGSYSWSGRSLSVVVPGLINLRVGRWFWRGANLVIKGYSKKGILEHYYPQPPKLTGLGSTQVEKILSDYVQYVNSQFSKLSTLVNTLADGHIDLTYKAPDKPTEGSIRYADGTLWNPGAGQGLYQFRSGVWVKIG